MGSFDVTCVLSDIGIGYGDRVVAFIAAEGKSGIGSKERGWSPVTYGFHGTYNDYGRVTLDEGELPDWMLKVLGENILPMEQGMNPYHEYACNPDDLSWEKIEKLVSQGRFIFNDGPRFNPNWSHSLQNVFNDHNIKVRVVQPGRPGSCVYYGEIKTHDLEEQLAIKEKVLNLPEVINSDYQVIVVPKTGQKNGISFIFAPKPGQDNIRTYWGYDPGESPHLGILIAREDVFNEIVPFSREIIEMGSLTHETIEGFGLENRPFINASTFHIMRPHNIGKRHGLYYGGEGHYAAERIITEMLKNTPTDSQEPFNRLVRAIEMYNIANGRMRRGLRPTVRHVGSQSSSDDLQFQLDLNKKMAKILEKAIIEDFYIYLEKDGEDWGQEFDSGHDFMEWVESEFKTKINNLDEAVNVAKENGWMQWE